MSKDATLKFQFSNETWILDYRDSGHAYMLYREGEAKKRVVSCSTLAKVSYNDPGGLMNWSANETKAGRDWTASRELAAACGTAAHDQLEALARTGKPLDLAGQPERVRGALQAVAKWWFEFKPQFVASEVLIASPTWRFAGRFDFLATVGGELVLCDLKTSEKEWWHFRKFKAEAAYAQMAGYCAGFAESYADSPQPVARYLLHVNTSGDFDWKRDLAPDESMDSFLSKVECYRNAQGWDKAQREAEKVELAEAA